MENLTWYKPNNNLLISSPMAYTSSSSEKRIEDFLRKYAGSTEVYVQGYNYPRLYNDVLDICEYLFYDIYYKAEMVLSPEDLEQWKADGVISDFFAPDGSDYDEPLGTINNYVKAFPPSQISWLITQTKKALDAIRVRVSDIIYEKYPDGSIRVIRWVMANNPNAFKKNDVPPKLNFRGRSANIILRLLGYPESDGSTATVLDAQATLTSINGFTPLKIYNMIEEIYGPEDPEKGSREATVGDLVDTIEVVRKIAQWAVDHKYKNIYFV